MDEDYVIVNDSSIYNFIYKCNLDGHIDKYSDNDKPNDCDFYISCIDFDKYVCDIKKSYNDDINKIIIQFEKDYC